MRTAHALALCLLLATAADGASAAGPAGGDDSLYAAWRPLLVVLNCSHGQALGEALVRAGVGAVVAFGPGELRMLAALPFSQHLAEALASVVGMTVCAAVERAREAAAYAVVPLLLQSRSRLNSR